MLGIHLFIGNSDDLRNPCTNPPHLNPQKMKGFEMLNDIKIDFFEDDKFKHKTGELKLCVADFAQLGIIVQAIRQAQNDSGIACHFKITAQSLDY
jgi:hypothetical protein